MDVTRTDEKHPERDDLILYILVRVDKTIRKYSGWTFFLYVLLALINIGLSLYILATR